MATGKEPPHAAEVEALIREIQRYLLYVEAFRSSARTRPPRRRKKRG